MRPIAAFPSRWLALVAAALSIVLLLSGRDTASADDGYATWYGPGFQGNQMNDGETFNMDDPTITACNIYPLGTWIKVTNPANGKSVVVQVRDRGGFDYALDLSYAAFDTIADPALMGIPVAYHVVPGPGGDPPPAPAPGPAPRPAASPSARPATTAAPPDRYTIQPGDTLNSIAAQFGLDSHHLAVWNGLSDADVITIGQTIRLTAPKAAAPTSASATHLVQIGDTLSSIARQYGTTMDQLQALNGLSDPNLIAPGQSLIVPSAPSKARTYVVQPGDTAFSIARAYGISATDLASANGLADANALQPGETHVVATRCRVKSPARRVS